MTVGIAAFIVFLIIGILQHPAQAQVSADYTKLILPPVALSASDLAIVVNDADPYSVEVGAYYAKARSIPAENIIHLRFAHDRSIMSLADFALAKAALEKRLPATVQALALTWVQPYRVECMSITAAFAFGFDKAYCAEGCQLTKPSPYYNSDSNAPQRELGLRPSIMLAASDVNAAKAMIARGVRADHAWPQGTGYLMRTSDAARNVRARSYPHARQVLGNAVPLQEINADLLENKQDVLFYFTGLAKVDKIGSNHYVDGALADHLTSGGGALNDNGQMTVLAWIDAGVTGSYGNAIEPCNYPQKFPDVAVLMGRYLMGETLIEAYWKSVAMPGQGVFVGEPLATPFGGVKTSWQKGDLLIRTRALRPGQYLLQGADDEQGPFHTIGQGSFPGYATRELRIPHAAARVYRLQKMHQASVTAPAKETLPETFMH